MDCFEPSFLEEEVKNVLSIEPDKSSRFDGFYQTCWDIIKGDLMKVFQEFFERGRIIKWINATFIVLILKRMVLIFGLLV